MRNLKRALSLALASVMLLGMMVVGTSAASYPDVKDSDNVEAIEVLNAVKVMVGDRGNFRPDSPVNRHEMAAIMARLYLGKDAAENYVGNHPFTDVYPWADKYVAACYENGLVNGTSKTTFSGNQPLTAIQAAAMMLRALGYEDLSKNASDWRTPVAAKANSIRLFKDVVASPNAQLTRNQVAQLALNTLKSNVVKTEKGSTVNVGGVEITTDIKYTDEVDETYDYTQSSGNYVSGTSDKGLKLLEKLYEKDLRLVSTSSTADDLGRPAKQWKYKSKDVVKVADEASTVIVVGKDKSLVDVLKDENKDYYVDAAGDLAYGKFTTSAKNLYVNGTETNGAADADFFKVGDIVEVFTNSSDGDKIDTVVVTRYTLAKISKVDTNVSSTDQKDGVSCKLTLKNAADATIGTFKDTDFAGYNSAYEKDTYVAVVTKGSKVLDSYAVTPAAEGKISAYKADVEYTIDGTKYKTAKSTFSSNSGWTADDFTGTYAAYTDKNGYLIGIVEVEAGKAASDAVYVVKMWNDSTSASYGAKVITFYAQVVDMDGKVENVVIGRTNESGEIIGVGLVEKTGDTGVKGWVFDTKAAIASGKYYVATDGTIKPATGNAGATADEVADVGYSISATNAAIELNKLYTMDENEDDKYIEMTAYTDKVNTATIANNTEVKVDATKLGSYYLDGETKYIVVEKSGADIKVTVKTGGLGYKNTSGAGVTATVVYRTSGRSEIANYVIVPVTDFSTADSDEMLYVKSIGGKTSDGYMYTVYMPDGSEEDINVKSMSGATNGNSATKHKFFTFSEDDKGLYKLTLASGSNVLGSIAGDATWDGGTDDHTGVGYDVTFANFLNDRLTIDGVNGHKLNEIKAAGAIVIDLHETEQDDYADKATKETYSGTVNDLDAINGLDNDYTVKMDVNIDKDGVVIVFVTDIAKTTHGFTAGTPTNNVPLTIGGAVASISDIDWTSTTGADTAAKLDGKALTITLSGTTYTVTFKSTTSATDGTEVAVAGGTTTNFKAVLEAAVAGFQTQANAAATAAAAGTTTYTEITDIAITGTASGGLSDGTCTTTVHTYA